MINEDAKYAYMIRRRCGNVYSVVATQGHNIALPVAAAANVWAWYPALLDRNDATDLATACNYQNPTATDARFAKSGHISVQRSSVLSLRLYNGSTLNRPAPEVFVQAYLCAPRRKLTSDSLVNGVRTDYAPDLWGVSFGAQQPDPTGDYPFEVGTQPYMANQFTETFKILKRKSFTLTIQRPFRKLAIKKKWLDFNYREWIADSNTTKVPKQSLEWLIIIKGALGRDPGNDQVSTVPARVDYEMITKYKWFAMTQVGAPSSIVNYVSRPANVDVANTLITPSQFMASGVPVN